MLANLEDRHYLRYLRMLGISKQRPGKEYLKRIVSAQASRIPFENISKLFYKKHLNLKHLLDFELFLEGIEKYGFGGTCYANNYYLNQLLNWLGFDVKLCGADMENPDVHVINIVSIESREYLVDTGYAAPFSEPLPLHLSDNYTLDMGLDRYVLKPQLNDKSSQIELYRKGELIHGYRINPKARNINEFQEVIENSFEDNATFMNALLLTRFKKDTFIAIHNKTIIESLGKVWKEYLTYSNEQLATEIYKWFGIPKTIVLESIDGLQMQKNGWS